MDGNKQIKEMADIIASADQRVICKGLSCLTCELIGNIECYGAKAAYNAGYRKSSEVAREIFEEIDKLAYRFMNDRHYIFGDMVYDLAELKKKYTEEEK